MPFVGGMFGFGGGSTPEHVASGALSAQAALLAGAANRYALHSASGAMVAQAALLAGSSVHPHIATGSVIAASASVSGTAVLTVADDPVKLLLHMEGDSPFIDDSIYNWTVTKNGTVSASSTQAKFGTYSLTTGGTSSDYLSVADNSEFDFGAEDLTFEYWCFNNGGGGDVVSWQTGTSNATLSVTPGGKLAYRLPGYGNGTTIINVPVGEWVFMAACRDSLTWHVYVNATRVMSVLGTSASATATNSILVGYANYQGPFDGYIDEVRITRGIARYTASTITVPSAAFPDP